jgi:hypothetical protein
MAGLKSQTTQADNLPHFQFSKAHRELAALAVGFAGRVADAPGASFTHRGLKNRT